jgi:D-alanyl-D-alanine dipeptidase
VAKKDLFKEHYISKRSGHSRGSTVDLTIVSLNTEEKHQELDMGTGFDLFGPNSWPDDPSMNINQRAHRLLLQMLMKKHGFKSSRNEWWHFALEDEPYPDTYFDFPVE